MIVLADGRNVFPEDVESVLEAEPSIKACAVIGKPGPDGAEQVHAVLIPSNSADEAIAAVRLANGRLGPHQQVSGWTIWPEPDFPRTPTLKIKRFEVLQRVKQAPEQRAVSTPASGVKRDDQLIDLLARATRRPSEEIKPHGNLALDLGLDSLGRVELAALLEEELGRWLPDEEMAVLQTVAELRAAIDQAGPAEPGKPLARWPRQAPARSARELLQRLVLFPLLRACCRPLRVSGRERISSPTGPVLLIANHSSHLDSLLILSLLPPAHRGRTAVAAAADYFFEAEPLATFSALALGAFPFHREGGFARSLAHCGDLVDEGYSLLLFPEGTRSLDGRLQPFKPGVGLLGRELRLPIVPIYLAGLHEVLPKASCQPRPGPVHVSIGEPLRLEDTLSNVEATEALEAAVRNLAATNSG
jgi:long-chain acyl-CoA synthetase